MSAVQKCLSHRRFRRSPMGSNRWSLEPARHLAKGGHPTIAMLAALAFLSAGLTLSQHPVETSFFRLISGRILVYVLSGGGLLAVLCR